jgi:hypothetical protein
MVKRMGPWATKVLLRLSWALPVRNCELPGLRSSENRPDYLGARLYIASDPGSGVIAAARASFLRSIIENVDIRRLWHIM